MKCIDPRLARLVDALSEDDQVVFEERAAIREYDGGFHRAVAEQKAWHDFCAMRRRVK